MSVRTIESVLRRDRLVLAASLTALTLLAWAYLVYLAWDMQHMDMDMAMPQMQAWATVEYVLMFVMWAVMMASAAPMILLGAGQHEHQRRFLRRCGSIGPEVRRRGLLAQGHP